MIQAVCVAKEYSLWFQYPLSPFTESRWMVYMMTFPLGALWTGHFHRYTDTYTHKYLLIFLSAKVSLITSKPLRATEEQPSWKVCNLSWLLHCGCVEINTVHEAILVVLVATQPTMAVPAPLNIWHTLSSQSQCVRPRHESFYSQFLCNTKGLENKARLWQYIMHK